MIPTTTLVTVLSLLPLAAQAQGLFERAPVNATTSAGVVTKVVPTTIVDTHCGCVTSSHLKTYVTTVTVPGPTPSVSVCTTSTWETTVIKTKTAVPVSTVKPAAQNSTIPAKPVVPASSTVKVSPVASSAKPVAPASTTSHVVVVGGAQGLVAPALVAAIPVFVSYLL